jgi:phosphonate transport system ATP-binding protein
MDRVGIAHYANKRADELSGGERQRVGVVRALMREPEIQLADEPTASLETAPRPGSCAAPVFAPFQQAMVLRRLRTIRNISRLS